ncbi:MAG: hypothetical protein IJQ81_06355 [Oscillibacter sp.]|nr:hypothetical protein [Oscillibacter sp.]
MKDCAQEWVKANLSDSADTEIPLSGQSVVLYLCPRDRTKAWTSDIGSL